jgi:hypothetical protein
VVGNQESGLGQARGLSRWVSGLIAVVLVSWLGSCRLGELPFREEYERFRAIKPGMTEKEVRDRLGTPVSEHQKGTPSERFCVPGRWCEKRAISNRLLVFIAGEPIAYVFIGPDNRVEYVSVGGS